MLSRLPRRAGLWMAFFLIGGPAIWLAGRAVLDYRYEATFNDRVDEIIGLIDLPKSASFRGKVDAVRVFVNDHSQDKIDHVFHAMNGDGVAFAEGLIAHARDPAVERVHMECSTRANLMGRILRRLDIKTRTIALFATTGRFSSHSFLDVYNPDRKTWETVDPDYDLYWIAKSTGERVSLAEAANDLDDLEPCGRDRCGWDLVSRDDNSPRSLLDKLDILSVTDKEVDVRYAVYTPRADLSRKLSFRGETGTFCEMFPKRCRDGFYAMGDPATRTVTSSSVGGSTQ